MKMKFLLGLLLLSAPATVMAQGLKVECINGKCRMSGPPLEIEGGGPELVRLRKGAQLSCADENKDFVIQRSPTGIVMSCEPTIFPNTGR